MRIRCAFALEPGRPTDETWLVGAVDEWTEDEHGGPDPAYKGAVEQAKGDGLEVRELFVHVPDRAVQALWGIPNVDAEPNGAKEG